jgi:23S rRNA (cytidine2498-2'-O)-methyltransferase
VWQRDRCVPGEKGFEPGVTPLAKEVAATIVAERPNQSTGHKSLIANRRAKPGDCVLDCILVEPNDWWFGYHHAAAVPSRFPGGVCLPRRRKDVISRAYWKMAEALTWSQMPVRQGDRCVEIGCAPGGASQALLDAGLHVLGIDPAEVDERLEDHPRFRHIKKRAADVKRREFRGMRWLVADSNVVPKQTLDAVESIVTHDQVHVRGMLLTLKLLDWQLADAIPQYVARIHSWGYRYVRVRQLAHNRREVCVAAFRVRSMRRPPPWQIYLQKQLASNQTKTSDSPPEG